MACTRQFRVEGVKEASFTETCLLLPVPAFMEGVWLGLVHWPLVRELASFESCRTALKEQGCVPGSEAVRYSRIGLTGRGGEGGGRGLGSPGQRWSARASRRGFKRVPNALRLDNLSELGFKIWGR